MNPNNLAEASVTTIEGFLSYSHESDEFLQIAEPLHRDLVRAIKLTSNRHIEIFRDRTSIKWGSRWEAAIDNGLANASVLFVIATTDYLNSANCRAEFLDFLNAANSSGNKLAKKLILPIVPVNSPVFSLDSEDEVARQIAEIQFESIQEAVIEGEKSPAWRRALFKLAERFIEVVSNVEEEAFKDQIEGSEDPQNKVSIPASDQTLDGEGSGSEELGFLDAIASVEEDFEEMTSLAQEMGSLLNTVSDPVAEIDLGSVSSAKEMNRKLALVAHQMEPNSKALGEVGKKLREKTSSIDLTIRSLVRIANENGDPLAESVSEFLKNAHEAMSVTYEVEGQMASLLDSMAPAEAASSILRKSLKPMRSGIVAFSDAMQIMKKWGPDLLK